MKMIKSNRRKKSAESNSAEKPATPEKVPETGEQPPLGEQSEPLEVRASFRDILDRLHDANAARKELVLSPTEVNEVYSRMMNLEICAQELPIWVQKTSCKLPAEIIEFTQGSRVRGTNEAEAERMKKWMALFYLRIGQYQQELFKTLCEPRVEAAAASHICELMQNTLARLKETAELTAPQLKTAAKAASETYQAITKCFAAKIDAPRKARSRAKKKSGRLKKMHSSEFTNKCEVIVQEFINNHLSWLESPDDEPLHYYYSGLSPSRMPNTPFGLDNSERDIWEKCIFGYLKHRILVTKGEGERMRSLWTSHLSDLKNRLIPGYWGKATLWRAKWRDQQIEFQ